MPQTHWYQELFTRRMLICVFTGFSSGLPLYLLLNLVPAWLKTEQIDLKAIGLVIAGAISLHLEIYLVTVDRPLSYSEFRPPPRLDVDLSIGIDCGDCGAGFFSPQTSLWTIAYLAFGVAFFSASQDIVLDAYRREILSDHELGLGEFGACECLSDRRFGAGFVVADSGRSSAVALGVPDHCLVYVAGPDADINVQRTGIITGTAHTTGSGNRTIP
jgi:hypothetical protein